MRLVAIVNIGLVAVMLAGTAVAFVACTPEATPTKRRTPSGGDDDDDDNGPAKPAPSSSTGIPDGPLPPGSAPRAVPTAGTTEIPKCSSNVDAAGGADFTSIKAAVDAAKNGEIICVAEGDYAGEQLTPGAKNFTIAGGFQSGKDFKVRDSAKYVTKVKGGGSGSFYKATEDAVPRELIAFDGLDISGYAQAIVRATYFKGAVDITNNNIHDNDCKSGDAIGGGAFLSNVKATIKGNHFINNTCGRGGAVAIDDTLNTNEITVANNLVQGNSGMQTESAHGGAVYLFGNKITVTANVFLDNEVVAWGGGLFVGSNTGGGIVTNAKLSWNVFRNNKAGIFGGGFFCDDGGQCTSEHDIFDGNCGGNVFVDSGPNGSAATKANFSYMTNVNAKAVGCGGPGPGFQQDHGNEASDAYTITNSIFFGNAQGQDLTASCQGENCNTVKINVSYSMVQKEYVSNGSTVTFGAGIIAPSDPLFVDASKVDFHLQSSKGHWTPSGYVNDSASSPALAKGNGPADQNPAKAGDTPELGAYGNSGEASYTQ